MAHGAAGLICLNCGTARQGPFCHRCGQSEEACHRSLRHLLGELLEGLTHADSRLWRTLGQLFFAPDRLTRRYVEGHRVSELPPLRMFLIMLALLFATSSIGPVHIGGLPQAEQARATQQIDRITIGGFSGPTAWARRHIRAALDDPQALIQRMQEQAERFAFLMLPIAAGLLALLFPFRRDLTLFDHTIFALHSLTAAGLTIVLLVALARFTDLPALWLLLALPLHLFAHLRGFYGAGVLGAVLRMLLLALGSLLGFLVILSALALTALALAGD